jgi:hypothetical protein
LDFNMPKMQLLRASATRATFERYPAFVDGTRMLVTTPEGKQEGFTFRWIAGSEAINKIGVNGATRYVPSFPIKAINTR